MGAAVSLISELEDVIRHGTRAKRVDALQRITALFLDGAKGYSDAHVDLFDDVFGLLIVEIETTLRVSGKTLLETVDQFTQQGLHMRGVISLSQGFVISSIIYAAIVAFVIDHKFKHAAGWLLGAIATTDAVAGNFDAFSVHGFGTQTYFQTSANTYLGADHSGTWDNNFLGLVGAVDLNDKSKRVNWQLSNASSAVASQAGPCADGAAALTPLEWGAIGVLGLAIGGGIAAIVWEETGDRRDHEAGSAQE